MLEWLTIPLLLAAFLAWFVWSSRRDKVRGDAELVLFGQRHGLRQETFTVDIFGPRTVAYGELWPDLADFQLGGQRVTIRNVWRGPWNGGEIRLFDFHRSHGESGRAILFESPALDLPSFVVLPYPNHRAAVEGVTTIGTIAVLTRDAAAVQRVFTPEVVAFFKQREEGRRTWAEGRGHRLLYYKLVPRQPRHGFHPPDVPSDAGNEGLWDSAQALVRSLARRA